MYHENLRFKKTKGRNLHSDYFVLWQKIPRGVFPRAIYKFNLHAVLRRSLRDNNLMKAYHYYKSHQIPSDSLEKMNIVHVSCLIERLIF